MPLTDDLSDGFFRQVKLMCANLSGNPLDALKVWFSESIGVFASARNPAGAYGINQITDLRGVGWTGTADEYVALTAEQQLPYVENYYRPYKGKLTSVARLYQINFLPATIATVTQPNDVLCAKAGPYSGFYNQNQSLDPANPKKGYITLDDLRQVVEKAIGNTFKLKSGEGSYADRWKEIEKRLGAGSSGATPTTSMLIGGSWLVTTREGIWKYQFWADGRVIWSDSEDANSRGTGSWVVEGENLKLTFSLSQEFWDLPLNPFNQTGEVRRSNGMRFPLSAKRPIDN